jgi:hypothetical protein
VSEVATTQTATVRALVLMIASVPVRAAAKWGKPTDGILAPIVRLSTFTPPASVTRPGGGHPRERRRSRRGSLHGPGEEAVDSRSATRGKAFRCEKSQKDVPLEEPRCLNPKAYCRVRTACPIHALERDLGREKT